MFQRVWKKSLVTVNTSLTQIGVNRLKCILYLKFKNFLCQSRMQDQFVRWMLDHAQDLGGKEARSWPRSGGKEARSWPRSGGKEARSWPRSREQGSKIMAKI